MTAHIVILSKKEIHISIRAEGDGIIGDYFKRIKTGESFCGISFDELLVHGDGPLEIRIR